MTHSDELHQLGRRITSGTSPATSTPPLRVRHRPNLRSWMAATNYSERAWNDPDVEVRLVDDDGRPGGGFIDARRQFDGRWQGLVRYTLAAPDRAPYGDWFDSDDLDSSPRRQTPARPTRTPNPLTSLPQTPASPHQYRVVLERGRLLEKPVEPRLVRRRRRGEHVADGAGLRTVLLPPRPLEIERHRVPHRQLSVTHAGHPSRGTEVMC